jgi:hypothetical protein
MNLDDQYRSHDLLRRLMAWRDDGLELNLLWAETGLLCGAEKIADLPRHPTMLREKLIDVLEDYLDSSSSSRPS